MFVAQVGRRLAGDQRLVSEVLETIANNKPDLFAVAADDTPVGVREPAPAPMGAVPQPAAAPELLPEDGGHG